MSTILIHFRRRRMTAVAVGGIALLAFPMIVSAQSPWLTNSPIADIQKEVYIQHTQDGAGVSAVQWSAGPGLQRIEYSSVQNVMRDIAVDVRQRTSSDNGQTWSAYSTLPNSIVNYAGIDVFEGSGQKPTYDPQAGVLIQPWIRQMEVGGIYHTFAYYRLSQDFGASWSNPKQLKYEAGADFDPLNPLSSSYINHNEGEYGQNFALLSNGKLVMGLGHASNPADPNNNNRSYRLGYLDFVGQWNSTIQDYDWDAGQRNFVSSSLSRQGMGESTAVELSDGRVMNLWRGMGNSGANSPGHSWFTVSNDNGLTLGALQELKYDDGSGFYSPAAQANLIRLQSNGKLYWIGNISQTVTYDGLPRYPLVIGEVDETTLALKKSTVTMIDTLLGQASSLELSNFSWVENSVTNKLEVYLSNWGHDASNEFNADAYRYTLDFVNLPAPPDVSATWTSLGAGTFHWNAISNSPWNTATFPNHSRGVANLGVNSAANKTINLNQTITLGVLSIGDTGGNNDRDFTINTGAGGNGFVFDNGASDATFSKVDADGVVTVNAPITVSGNGTLNVSSSAGALHLTGALAGGDDTKINFTGSTSLVEIKGDISSFHGDYNINLGGSTLTFRGTTPVSQDGSHSKFNINGTTTGLTGTFRWAEDTVDKSPTIFKMGELSGKAYLRNQGNHPTTLQIGFLNTSSEFSGVIANGGQPPALPGSPAEAVSVEKVGSGTLTLSGANTYQGTTQVGGGTLIVNGTHIAGGAYTVVASATLGGTGTIQSNVVVNAGGALAPGDGLGTFAAGSAQILGTLSVEYNGNTSVIDQLNVSGALDISAATVDFDNLGSAGLSGGPYVLAHYGSLVGAAFAHIIEPPSGYFIDYDYLNTKQIALVATDMQGDYNLDGEVSGADYVLWRKNPLNYDGDPNGYDAWRSNYSSGIGSSSSFGSESVPEPTACALLIINLCGWLMLNGRSASKIKGSVN